MREAIMNCSDDSDLLQSSDPPSNQEKLENVLNRSDSYLPCIKYSMKFLLGENPNLHLRYSCPSADSAANASSDCFPCKNDENSCNVKDSRNKKTGNLNSILYYKKDENEEFAGNCTSKNQKLREMRNQQSDYNSQIFSTDQTGIIQDAKYVLQFDPSSSPSNDYIVNRLKCKAFWNLVDSEPNLQDCIVEGHYVHVSSPRKIEVPASKVEEVTKEIQVPEVNCREEARNRMKRLQEEERQRVLKRKQYFEMLEEKSGLRQTKESVERFTKLKEEYEALGRKIACKPLLADLCTDTADQALKDMKAYDSECKETLNDSKRLRNEKRSGAKAKSEILIDETTPNTTDTYLLEDA